MKNINLIQLKRELSQLEKCITKYSETSESAMGSIFDVSTQSDLIKVQFKNFESLNVKLSQKYNESTEFSLIELIKNAQIKAYTNTSKMSMNLTLNADVINLNRYKGAIRVLDFIFTIFIEICIHGGVKNCNLCHFDNSYSSNLTFILYLIKEIKVNIIFAVNELAEKITRAFFTTKLIERHKFNINLSL